MRSLLPLLPFSVLLPFAVQATVWQVGPGLTYTLPSQVSALVGNGDTVDIVAGVYPSDVAAWTADDLLLRGVGGLAHLESNGLAWGQKAIWVIQGDRTTVEWIEFSECSVPDQNGAGIRQEGLDLTVRHCYFHDNENGILAGEVHPSTILVEHSEFAYNGFGDGFSHNLYIGNVDSLIFRFNYSHHANVGQELKSRAHVNMIEYNRLSNEAGGTASREIDMPNGGQAYLIGNVIQQGPAGQNSNMVGFGVEGLNNPGPHRLYAVNNTLVNEKTVGTFFEMPTSVLFKAYNNVLAGGGSFMNTWPFGPDTAANVRNTSIPALGFADAANYDYHIAQGSPANNAGIPAGVAISGYPLVAWYEYVHPMDSVIRCQHALLAAGAYEVCATSIHERTDERVLIFPNPAGDELEISFTQGPFPETVEILDIQGRVLGTWPVRGRAKLSIDVHDLCSGVLVFRTLMPGSARSRSFLKQ
ncbi:MAG: hypothetical protein KA175_16175 [Flavobacteriales bacterium]|nr:hypothetical protein [Flavobacteriales bacterium]MBP6699160.1 hypothetical protein [Flavobacteriales bacterium]